MRGHLTRVGPQTRLERLHRRRGWRGVVVVYLLLSWLVGLVGGLVGGTSFARFDRWSASVILGCLAALLAIWLIGLALGLAGSLRLARPLRALDERADAAQLSLAWQAALRWPARATGWNCAVATLFCYPALYFSIVAIAHPDTPLRLTVLLFGVGALVVAGTVGLFGAQLAMRPVLTDLAARLDPRPEPESGTSVRLRLVVVVPALTVTLAAGAVVLGAPPGGHPWTLLGDVLIAGAATTLLAVPATLLVAQSLLQPLDDVLHATQRLKQGDFTTPVPELSSDEYGTLARSFNEAMKGLAERQRLAAQNEELLEEVRASRARIVAASDAERRRVERNIHDGAQQQLVALALDLELLGEQAAAAGAEAAGATAQRARETLHGALRELRELARGLHPSVLSTDGLSPALEQLAARAGVPIEVRAPGAERFPDAVEATAYFVACEALANVGKYAHASRAQICVERRNGDLVVEVRDDGVGGASPERGSGLAGLADRVAALDGTFSVESRRGAGTVVRAELPLEEPGP